MGKINTVGRVVLTCKLVGYLVCSKMSGRKFGDIVGMELTGFNVVGLNVVGGDVDGVKVIGW